MTDKKRPDQDQETSFADFEFEAELESLAAEVTGTDLGDKGGDPPQAAAIAAQEDGVDDSLEHTIMVKESSPVDIFIDATGKADQEQADHSLTFAEQESDGLCFTEQLSLQGQVEAILFASPKPMKPSEIADIIQDEDHDIAVADVEAVITHLMRQYEESGGGFTLIHEKGVGYQFQTVPAASRLMEKMFSSRPRPLSRAALETLSIIAYRQPTTRAEIEYVRGVDAGSIIKNLLDRELIRCVGRKEDAGRPMVFGTTAEFLKVFNLKTLGDLPPLASFQPPSDILKNSQIDIKGPVDVEEFVGDQDQEQPEVSVGLEQELPRAAISDEQDDDETPLQSEADSPSFVDNASARELVDGSERDEDPPVPGTSVTGATQFDFNETEQNNDSNKNSKISLPTRDSLKEGS